jgi:hypothetical protein
MKNLITLFPYAARKERKHRPVEDDFPDSPSFTREFKIILGVIALFLMIPLLIALAAWWGYTYNQ